MKATEIKTILKLAKKAGARRIKTAEFEVEFFDLGAGSAEAGPSRPRTQIRGDQPAPVLIDIPEDTEAAMPTDEQMLEWSSPTFDRFNQKPDQDDQATLN